ncbi:MAG TPA: protein kinase [Pirellulales bacterium]|nr:protein kinase [Pirellulales bacterium]
MSSQPDYPGASQPRVDHAAAAATFTHRPADTAEAETVGRSDEFSTAKLPEGRTFGDYELLAEIARGGMGVVFKAQQRRLNRTVAVKMILAGELADQNDVQRFLSEAEAAAGLDHPGIVPVYESGEINGQHYFSMGFVDGQSLAAVLSGGPLPPRHASELVAQVAEAVDYAHQRGVIHRDLKPGNILLDREGHPRVTDFGLAKRVAGDSGLTRTGQALGTPSYMPPEQASGKLEAIGRAADVYALGAVLYAALTGRPPFQAATPLDTILQVLEQEPVAPRQLNAGVPRDLETVTLKCLEKEPHKRYATARDLADELGRFSRGEPIHARPVGRSERAWRWCCRKPVMAALIAAVCITLVAGTATSTYFAIEANRRAGDAETSALVAQNAQRAEAEQLARARSALAAETRAKEAESQARAAQTTAKNEARAAINRYVDTVFESQLLKDDRFQPLRKKLLSDALGYYKTFIESHEHDTTERRELAEVLRRVGSISRDTGSLSDAVAAYSRAAELYQQISAEEPSVPGYRNEVAVIYNSIGVLHKNSGEKSAAEALYLRSREISEKLVAEYPSNAEYRSNLAYTCHNLAMLETERGEPDAARANFGRAIEIDEKLVAQFPQVADYRCDLARHYHSLGCLQRDHGPRTAARANFQHAIEIAEKLVDEQPGNPEYHFDLANICYSFGLLDLYGGEREAARASFLRAIKIAKNLAAQHPTVAAFRAELAGSYLASLGQLESASGQREAARATLQRALETAEKLVADDPAVLTYRHILAARCLDLARLQVAGGELAAARATYGRAIEIEEKLVAEKPANADYRSVLSYCYNSLGLLETDLGEREALGHLQRSLDLFQSLAALQPDNRTFDTSLAGTHCNLANAQRRQGKLHAALEHYAQAAEILEDVLTREPGQSTARLFLRNTFWGRGQTLMALDRFAEAAEAWRRAIELNTVPETTVTFGLELAESLARAGDHHTADQEATAVAEAAKESTETLYRLAGVFSLCSEAAKDDTALADRYAGRAVELLRQSRAAGFFGVATNDARFRQDHAFDALRGRDAFVEFVAELSTVEATESPKNP